MSRGPLARRVIDALYDSLDEGTWLALHKNTFTVTVDDTRSPRERDEDEAAGFRFETKLEVPILSRLGPIEVGAYEPIVWRMTQLGSRLPVEFAAKGMSISNAKRIEMNVEAGDHYSGRQISIVSVWTTPIGGEMLFATELHSSVHTLNPGDIWRLEAGALEYRIHID